MGNRGAPNLHWRSGLRESKITTAYHRRKAVSLFVDNIPKGLDRGWLRRLFERHGEVCDLFISTKKRKNRSELFGFVRYSLIDEAEQAIEGLHQHVVRGRKLWVSMAKYGKDGCPMTQTRNQDQQSHGGMFQNVNSRYDGRSVMGIHRTNGAIDAGARNENALRDDRRYVDVVAGVRRQMNDLRKELTQTMNIIPVTRSLNVKEDNHIKNVLQRAIIAENSEPLDLELIKSDKNVREVNFTELFYLSPTKLLLVFDCQLDATNALAIGSKLWDVFDNIALWSEGELFDDRLVWIDCFGVHPLCCTNETLKTIGEVWGPVLQIERNIQGIETITGARILIRTKAQNKIDNRIRLVFDHGSCDVWVKESYGSCINNCAEERKNRRVSNDIQPYFDDPLVQEVKIRSLNRERPDWVDPIVYNENIYWSDVDSCDCGLSRQAQTTPTISPLRANKSSRPRGRPKKSSDPGLIEASKTWEIAKTLGITVDDENAVLSGLRKSKRILILEDKGE